ncbi:MAG: PilZ domain-containing protein [Elsteraceae bacterium]
MAKSHRSEAAKLAQELLTDLGHDNRKVVEQRSHQRRDTPSLHVMIGGIRFDTIDWSLGGMLLRGLGERLKSGDRLQVLLWDGVDELKHHAVTALVVRYDEVKGGIAFHFVEMGPTTMPWLSDLQRG